MWTFIACLTMSVGFKIHSVRLKSMIRLKLVKTGTEEAAYNISEDYNGVLRGTRILPDFFPWPNSDPDVYAYSYCASIGTSKALKKIGLQLWV